jgi:hypothetical protein
VRVRPSLEDKDLTAAAKRLGLETVGECLLGRNADEPTTTRRLLDSEELVAYVLASFDGARLVERSGPVTARTKPAAMTTQLVLEEVAS